MLRAGKLENYKREMARADINVMGLCEVRWKGNGDFVSEGVRVMYSGGEESQRGVAIMVDEETARSIVKVECRNYRLMMVRISAEPVDIVVVQVYMPTSDHEDIEVEGLYEKISEMIGKGKANDFVVIMGDFNAVIG